MVARLKGNAGVGALVGQRIYDGKAPQGAELPYTVVGDQTERPRRAYGRAGYSDTLTVHHFSSYDGSQEVLAMVAATNAALQAPLVLAGFQPARLKPEFTEVVVEEDGTRHAPVRYRINARA